MLNTAGYSSLAFRREERAIARNLEDTSAEMGRGENTCAVSAAREEPQCRETEKKEKKEEGDGPVKNQGIGVGRRTEEG